LLIIDEGHYLKSFNAKRTQIILGSPGDGRKITLKTKKILSLSANPIANHVGEIYPFFWAVKSHVVFNKTEDDFLNIYAEKVERTKFGLKVTGVKNEDYLLKKQNFYLRRTIDDVDKDIAGGVRTYVDIPIDKDILKEENEMSGLLENLLRESKLKDFDIEDMLDDPDYFIKSMSTLPNFVQYAEFRKRQGLIKIKPVMEYLKENIFPDHKKMILFCVHRDVAKIYYEQACLFFGIASENTADLESTKQVYSKQIVIKQKENTNLSSNKKSPDIKIILVHGGIDPQTRFELLQEAKQVEHCILISTIGAIKEGHNLQQFRHSFFCEIDWRYYVHLQCEYRTRRIGSTETMFWVYFLFNVGMEKKIFKIFESKKETLDKVYK